MAGGGKGLGGVSRGARKWRNSKKKTRRNTANPGPGWSSFREWLGPWPVRGMTSWKDSVRDHGGQETGDSMRMNEGCHLWCVCGIVNLGVDDTKSWSSSSTLCKSAIG